MRQFFQNFLPKSFEDTWVSNENRRAIEGLQRRYEFRNDGELFIPPCRTVALERHPYFHFPRLWAGFDRPELNIIRTKTEFNSKLKQYFLDQLDENFKCERLLCPVCHINVNAN